jgi:hypothetical protein
MSPSHHPVVWNPHQKQSCRSVNLTTYRPPITWLITAQALPPRPPPMDFGRYVKSEAQYTAYGEPFLFIAICFIYNLKLGKSELLTAVLMQIQVF